MHRPRRSLPSNPLALQTPLPNCPKQDGPIDPDHLPTLDDIEAQVRRRPFGRTIAGICREQGLRTHMLRDAVMEANACYQGDVHKAPRSICSDAGSASCSCWNCAELRGMFPDKLAALRSGAAIQTRRAPGRSVPWHTVAGQAPAILIRAPRNKATAPDTSAPGASGQDQRTPARCRLPLEAGQSQGTGTALRRHSSIPLTPGSTPLTTGDFLAIGAVRPQSLGR